MNSYKLVSIGQIIGSVIRRVGLKDTSLIPDINEWAAECMQILQYTPTLKNTYEKDMKVSFHKVKKPCGMVELYAIEYCGRRLRSNNTIRDPRVPWFPSQTHGNMDATFMTTITQQNTPNGNFFWESNAEELLAKPWHVTEWYKEENNHILTSFEDGYITTYFSQVPTDKDGYLMIVDEGKYKESMRWFLRARLAGRGYEYGKMDEGACDQRFELWAGRAAAEITYPSVEKVQATLDTMLRLLPQPHYYESFFTGTGPSGLL